VRLLSSRAAIRLVAIPRSIVTVGLPIILRPIYVSIDSIVALVLNTSSSYTAIIVATMIVISRLT